jgi:hypothetical protein
VTAGQDFIAIRLHRDSEEAKGYQHHNVLHYWSLLYLQPLSWMDKTYPLAPAQGTPSYFDCLYVTEL